MFQFHTLYICALYGQSPQICCSNSLPLSCCVRKNGPRPIIIARFFLVCQKKSRKSYQWNPCQSRSQLPDHNRLHRKIQLRLQNCQDSVDYWCCFMSVFHTIWLEVSIDQILCQKIDNKQLKTVPIRRSRGPCLVSICSIIIVSCRCCCWSVATGIVTRAVTVAHSSSFLNFLRL